jgi:hypothetical protein
MLRFKGATASVSASPRNSAQRYVARGRERESWRRGWDSNPRGPFGPNGFQDRRLQPLGHPSKIEFLKHCNLRPEAVTVWTLVAALGCTPSQFCHSERSVFRLRPAWNRGSCAYNAWLLQQSNAPAIVAPSQCPRLDPEGVTRTCGAAYATSSTEMGTVSVRRYERVAANEELLRPAGQLQEWFPKSEPEENTVHGFEIPTFM